VSALGGGFPGRQVPLITLLTDYGHADPFVGVMKGVLYRLLPSANVIDLCHGIAPQAVSEAAYWLDRCQPWFPAGTLHVAVIDPTVGSARAILAAHIADHYFLVPDNGLLSQRLLEHPDAEIRAVNFEALGLRAASATFHGRDLFAPLAAWLAGGARSLAELGERATPQPSALPRAKASAGGVEGEVVTVDRFGNLITNIDAPAEHSARGACLQILGHTLALRSTYADVASGELVALVNSFGSVEIAERDGNAAGRLHAGRGTDVRLTSAQGP
jgi:S-adenosyl-L-methionine hydrolase (adenosine-forming)